jgi:hypothetical protein
MNRFIEVGILSYMDLSSAFVTTLLGLDGDDNSISTTQLSPMICGVAASMEGGSSGSSGTTTYFYLDPFDTESNTVDGNTSSSSCAGTDWVGEL